jgi:hypothetical protein
MPGQQRTKARKEREARAAAKRPVKPEVKLEALQLAEEHGPAEASRRTGVRAATIRTWQARAAQAGKPRVASSAPVSASAGAVEGEDGALPVSGAAALWARAERAAQAQARAEDRADKQIAKNQSAEARNSMVASNSFADRAVQLEAAAREAELHEVALSEAMGGLVLDLVAAVFADVALPQPEALLRARLSGWPAEPDAGVVEEAREQVRRKIVLEVREEMSVVPRVQAALPAGDEEVVGEVADDAESEPPAAEPIEAIADAEVVVEPELELPELGEMPDMWATIYPDEDMRRRKFAEFKYAQSDEGKAAAEAKRQAVADRIEAERAAAEQAETAARIEKRDRARREQHDRKARELPRMARRESPSRGPW